MGPLNITGTSGPNLPQNGVHIGVTTLTGPGPWTGVRVTETTQNFQSANLGDFTCAAATEIDVQRPASIADGGNDAVGAQPVGLTTLTYTIDNTAGTADLTIPAGGVTATNLTNVSGFTVNTALPLTVAAGNYRLHCKSSSILMHPAHSASTWKLQMMTRTRTPTTLPYRVREPATLQLSAACNGERSGCDDHGGGWPV